MPGGQEARCEDDAALGHGMEDSEMGMELMRHTIATFRRLGVRFGSQFEVILLFSS
jgi:hypothetical protein